MLFEAVEKAGINGLITGALTIPVFGTKAQILFPLTNQYVPLYLVSFLVGGLGSFAGDIVHLIFSELPVSKKFTDTSNVLLGVAINGGLFALMLNMIDTQVAVDFGTMTALCIGGAGEFLGTASYNYLKDNLYI